MTALLGSIGDDPLRARAVCAPLCGGRPALRAHRVAIEAAPRCVRMEGGCRDHGELGRV